jgi:hypothetical protein
MLVIFVVIHGLIHPILLPGSSKVVAFIDEQIKRAGASLPPGAEVESRMFIITNNPNFFFVAGVIGQRLNEGQFTPFLALSSGNHPLTCMRKDLYTIEVRSANGSLTDLDNVLVSKAYAMQPGQIVRLGKVVIEVLEVTNGLPSRAEFRFRVPIDDPGFLWFRWGNGTYVPFTPPDVGEEITIKGARFPRG